jgi:hypothetical protein
MQRLAATAVLVSLALALTCASCKPGKKKVGDRCEGNEASCADPGTILECQGGTLASMACGGPKGCVETLTGATTSEGKVTRTFVATCDFSTAAAGAACLGDEAACSADKLRMVACKDHKVLVAKCLGPRACTESARHIDCDTSVQPVGEPCDDPDAVACAPDGKQMLACASGKLAPVAACRGPRGCSSTDRKVDCDPGPAQEGDPCRQDGYACAAGGKALLKCANGKWIVDQKCKTTCVAGAGSAACR